MWNSFFLKNSVSGHWFVCCVVLGKLLSEVRFFSKTSLMEAVNGPSEVFCYPRSKDELLVSYAEVSGENFFFFLADSLSYVKTHPDHNNHQL